MKSVILIEDGVRMIEMDLHDFKIVGDGLRGQTVDEQTFASVSILAERLQRVKSLGKGFSEICFSPEVEQLAKQKSAVAVC